jgi:hypothetical protein
MLVLHTNGTMRAVMVLHTMRVHAVLRAQCSWCALHQATNMAG